MLGSFELDRRNLEIRLRVADLDRKDFPAVAVGGPNLILRAKQKFTSSRRRLRVRLAESIRETRRNLREFVERRLTSYFRSEAQTHRQANGAETAFLFFQS